MKAPDSTVTTSAAKDKKGNSHQGKKGDQPSICRRGSAKTRAGMADVDATRVVSRECQAVAVLVSRRETSNAPPAVTYSSNGRLMGDSVRANDGQGNAERASCRNRACVLCWSRGRSSSDKGPELFR